MLGQHRILVVDNDQINLNIISETLSEYYQIETSETGEDALKIIDQFSPDIVLLDIMMPGIDGYEVCRRIRANPKQANVKILFISAKEVLEDRLFGYKVGGDDYITKPFEEEELLAKVKVFLRLKYEEGIELLNKIAMNTDQSDVIRKVSQYFSSILYVKSHFPYCKIVCKTQETNSLLLRTSLKELEEQFKGQDLLRIHKSYIVNPIKIVSIRKKGNQDLVTILKDNDDNTVTIPVGRKYHSTLKKLNPRWFSN